MWVCILTAEVSENNRYIALNNTVFPLIRAGLQNSDTLNKFCIVSHLDQNTFLMLKKWNLLEISPAVNCTP